MRVEGGSMTGAFGFRLAQVAGSIALACAWTAAFAGTEPAPAAADAVVRCESEDLRRVQCPMDTSNGVDLVRQLSENACIREVDWGVDTQGVWVARGCRAEFRGRGQVAGVTRHVIRCESGRGSLTSCAVNLRGAPVRLLRQVSSLPCRQGETWGAGRNEVWVARGCKGEFEVGAREGGFPPGPRLLTCESKGRLKRFCGASVGDGKVILVRQLSGMTCEQGESWGWERDGVWVDHGCRAEFALP